MDLMGRYAAANHALIHAHVARALGAEVRLDVENHHNFAWQSGTAADGRERGDRAPQGRDAGGRRACSASSPARWRRRLRRPRQGHRGVAASAVARRRPADEPDGGEEDVHLGRRAAVLRERGVTLLSAGLDEVPMAYKDIDDGHGGAARSRRAAGPLRPAARQDGAGAASRRRIEGRRRRNHTAALGLTSRRARAGRPYPVPTPRRRAAAAEAAARGAGGAAALPGRQAAAARAARLVAAARRWRGGHQRPRRGRVHPPARARDARTRSITATPTRATASTGSIC